MEGSGLPTGVESKVARAMQRDKGLGNALNVIGRWFAGHVFLGGGRHRSYGQKRRADYVEYVRKDDGE